MAHYINIILDIMAHYMLRDNIKNKTTVNCHNYALQHYVAHVCKKRLNCGVILGFVMHLGTRT